jgi:hypothetical protein
MPSIKDIKDEINAVAHELINECYMLRHFHPSKETEINKVISQVITMQKDLIHRVNNPDGEDDSKALRTFYRKIRDDISKMSHLTAKMES